MVGFLKIFGPLKIKIDFFTKIQLEFITTLGEGG
jgi:hypothetical protein